MKHIRLRNINHLKLTNLLNINHLKHINMRNINHTLKHTNLKNINHLINQKLIQQRLINNQNLTPLKPTSPQNHTSQRKVTNRRSTSPDPTPSHTTTPQLHLHGTNLSGITNLRRRFRLHLPLCLKVCSPTTRKFITPMKQQLQ